MPTGDHSTHVPATIHFGPMPESGPSASDEIMAMIEAASKKEPCMSLTINRESSSVELCLDNTANTYSEWISGEGGDISLIRDRETNKVVGVLLPLYRSRLVVHGEVSSLLVDVKQSPDEQRTDHTFVEKCEVH